jgi:hypothetical protein
MANAKHGDQWRNTLATYADPVIGNVFVRDVEQSHVMRVLEPIWLDQDRDCQAAARPD